MHKGIIILMKEEDETKIKERLNEFMEEFKDDVWDWWQIGGRWSGELNKNNKIFYDKVKEKDIKIQYYSDIEKKETQLELQKIWNDLGEKTINPVCRDSFLSYKNSLFIHGNEVNDDIMKLENCIDIVRDWQQTIKEAKEVEEKAKRWLQRKNEKTGEIFDNWHMYGFCLKSAANLYQQNFCFDCNVFNIEKWNYSIPDDIENYYAIMIDIHN